MTCDVWLKPNRFGPSRYLVGHFCWTVDSAKFMFQAIRGQQPIRFSIQPALPPGMSLDTTTGSRCPPYPPRIPCAITR